MSVSVKSESLESSALGQLAKQSAARRAPLEKESRTLIEVQGLNFYYGKKQALFNVDLSIPRNRVTAFIGPSGCGKSTFLRTLNRMNDMIDSAHLDGKVLLDGEDIYAMETDVVELRRRVGMVFQKPNPFPMTIYDNVCFGPRLQGVKSKSKLEEVVEHCLKRAALWEEVKDRLNSSAMALSGGQQQRLCIARALANDPEVLLLDEPCSALDPKATAKIEDLIFELRGNYTIVMVTHNMQQAARTSDQTAFFVLGELIEEGATENLFTLPKKKETEDYITGRFG